MTTANPADPVAAAASPLLAGVARRRVALPDRGIEIALLDWGGDGPIALLHHANGFCAGTWGLVARWLAPHYRVIALDARGHGDSTAPPPGDAYAWIEFVDDLIPLAAHLADELDRPIALGMGNSFGGLVTAYAAAKRPGLFARVAMLDPVIRPPAHLAAEMLARMPAESLGRFQSPTNPMAEAARRRQQIWTSRQVARRVWSEKAMFREWDPRALDLYVAEGMRDRDDGQVELKCRGEVEASVFDVTATLDLFEVAPRLVAPTLLLRAGRGHFSMVVYESLAERIPDARLEELDIDHLMPMVSSPELTRTVLQFALATDQST